jgi:hypothetical protein
LHACNIVNRDSALRVFAIFVSREEADEPR